MYLILEQRLILVVAAVVILAYAAKRKWISRTETYWIGGALIFAANAWILLAMLNITRSDVVNRPEGIAAGIGLSAPLTAALIIGLIRLVRSLR